MNQLDRLLYLGIDDEDERRPDGPSPGKKTLTSRLPPAEPGATTSGDTVAPVAPAMRGAAESSLGMSLGQVRVHQGPGADSATRSYGALAMAVGSDIFLGSGVSNTKNPVMAHELAHVAQQQGASPGMAAKRGEEVAGPSEGAHEHEADAAALAIMAGRPARVTPTHLRLARFAPESHRLATAQGLSMGFTAEEIGMVYASNWERDFSQAIPEVGACGIAWKAVVNSAHANAGIPGSGESERFRGTADVLFNMPPHAFLKRFQEEGPQAKGESLSGYYSWEHMDRPDDKAVAAADKRWKVGSGDLAGYLRDAIAYIKDEMMVAVTEYRGLKKLKEMDTSKIDNWKGGAKPEGYDEARAKAGAAGNDTSKPRYADGTEADRQPVADEAARVSQDQKKMGDSPAARSAKMSEAEKEVWKVVGHHLGRAMHSFEDFWAHSNWVELATELKRNQGPAPKRNELFTGDFTIHSKLHALGHKISSMANSFLAGHSIMLQVYNRSKANASKLNKGKIEYPSLLEKIKPDMLGTGGGFRFVPELFGGVLDETTDGEHDDADDQVIGEGPRSRGTYAMETYKTSGQSASGSIEGAGTGGFLSGGLKGFLENIDPSMMGTGGGNEALKEQLKKGLKMIKGARKKVEDLKKEAESPDFQKAAELGKIFADQRLARALGLYETADFLCSPEWLQQLKTKGNELIEEADKATDAKGHGKVAKDQPEKHKGHGAAAAVAGAANKRVFGPLKGAMTETDPDKALAILTKQIAEVDVMIAPPSAGHPLFAIIKAAAWEKHEGDPAEAKGDHDHDH